MKVKGTCKFNDLTGKRVGTYTVVERVISAEVTEVIYRCVCDCGREKLKPSSSLIRNGKPVVKGCRKCSVKPPGEFSGWEKERSIWKDMVDRCHSSKEKTYKYYGARGIRVCTRWRNSFWDFIKDIGKIGDGMSIERIDNDGDYTPKNCKLIPRGEQCGNRRNTVWIEIDGVRQQLFKWLKHYNMLRITYDKRRGRGMTPEEALTAPKKYIGMWLHLAEK